MIAKGPQDFDSWNSLISEIENTYHDDINMICFAFDSFLSEFPLCHWNWKRYAYHKARLCNAEKAVEIFERAVESTPFSVGLWVDYCTFAMSLFEDPFDIRRLFTRGMSLVGKDYYCHVLWDKYMSFELSQENWGFLALVYVQALGFPTKKLHKYYENFKKFVSNLEEEIPHVDDDSHEVQVKELSHATLVLADRDFSQVVKDLQDPSDTWVRVKALYKYKFIGDELYQKACELEGKIKSFESNIQRRYFQATPLDSNELKNWHDYLDFIEKQEDFDWALKLHERCLVSCANYPEFWMRYVDFMEIKGGRELAIFALERATKVFSKNVPEIHLFAARYMEKIGDPDGARGSFPPINTDWDSYFIEYVTNQANMEKRLGNLSAACDVYRRAIEMSVAEQKLQCLPKLYIHYYRLKHMITASVEAARDVIIDGIKHIPGCRLLYEELLRFAMVHEGTAKQMSIVESVIAKAISSQCLDTKDRESISILFLEFVDLYGSISEIREARNRHVKLFPEFIRSNTSLKHPGTGKSLLHSFTEQFSNVLVNQPLSREEQMHKNGKQPLQLSIDYDKDVTGEQQQLSPNMENLPSGDGSGKNEDRSKDDGEDFSRPMDISQSGEDGSKSPDPVVEITESSRPICVFEVSRDEDTELEQRPQDSASGGDGRASDSSAATSPGPVTAQASEQINESGSRSKQHAGHDPNHQVLEKATVHSQSPHWSPLNHPQQIGLSQHHYQDLQQLQQPYTSMQQQQYFPSLPYPHQQFHQYQLQSLPQRQQLYQQQLLQQYHQSQQVAYQMQQHGYQLFLQQYQVCQQQSQQGYLQYPHQQYNHLEQQSDDQYKHTDQGQQVAVQHPEAPAPESGSSEITKQPVIRKT